MVYTHLAVIGEENVGLRTPRSVNLMGEYSRTGRGLEGMAGLFGAEIWRRPQRCWLGVCGATVRTHDHSLGVFGLIGKFVATLGAKASGR